LPAKHGRRRSTSRAKSAPGEGVYIGADENGELKFLAAAEEVTG
jgi:hypothetical protein